MVKPTEQLVSNKLRPYDTNETIFPERFLQCRVHEYEYHGAGLYGQDDQYAARPDQV